jgi:hypothetical protein
VLHHTPPAGAALPEARNDQGLKPLKQGQSKLFLKLIFSGVLPQQQKADTQTISIKQEAMRSQTHQC